MAGKNTTGTKRMEQMRSEDHEHIQGMWARLGALEKSAAATESDIKSLSNGLVDIRSVLRRMEDRNKPNIQGMFIALLATCTFLVTIGGLTLAPLYRDQTRTYEAFQEVIAVQNGMRANRFTNTDGQHLEDSLSESLQTSAAEIKVNSERLAKIEGQLQVIHPTVSTMRN